MVKDKIATIKIVIAMVMMNLKLGTLYYNELYRGIHADVIVYIFAHLHTTLRTEENLLAVY